MNIVIQYLIDQPFICVSISFLLISLVLACKCDKKFKENKELEKEYKLIELRLMVLEAMRE